MIKFYKVSMERFFKDLGYRSDNIFDNIKLPKRATVGSAGYDFYSPMDFKLNPGETIKFPTGIRCQMDNGVVLMMYVRSSIGFKYQTTLDNSTGIIDEDYFNSDNEGHIWIKLTNHSKDKVLEVKAGEAVCQGLFMNYLTTIDDNTTDIRNGGIGSTSK